MAPTENQEVENRQVSKSKPSRMLLLRAIVMFRLWIRRLFALFEGTDAKGTIESISKGVELRGANVWILICATGLASIGLDVNSAAIIIGAMLISPLMSPILGIGLGIGINDKQLLSASLRNFLTAVALSILVSSIYFLLTPLGVSTAEIEARTSPTLLDVGVALFGGVAGIIAGSRKEKTNAIPGVAIATALMPPLCTAGFGLATGSWAYFFGAFYLFFINAVFISLSTYAIVRYLKFPYHEFPDERTRLLTRRWIALFVLIVAIPSGVIFYGVIDDLRERSNVKNYLEANLISELYEPINWERVERNDSLGLLKVYMVGAPIDSAKLDSCAVALSQFGLEDYTLRLIQMSISKEDEERLSEEAARMAMSMMEINQQSANVRQIQIDSLTSRIEAIKGDTVPLWSITTELIALLPEIRSISFTKNIQVASDSVVQVPLFMVEYAGSISKRGRVRIEEKLERYLISRTGLDTLIIRQLTK